MIVRAGDEGARQSALRVGHRQNPAGSTRAREPLTYRTDTDSQKIWADNRLSMDDAMLLINYYLVTHGITVSGIQRKRGPRASGNDATPPAKEELSPRH